MNENAINASDYAAVKAARSPEYNRRVVAHETGHAYLARACGSVVEFVTVVPNGEFAGRCVRRGASSASLNLREKHQQNPAPTTESIVHICAAIGAPEVGMPRVKYAEEITRTMVAVTELVGARVCERVLFPNHEPLPAEHDMIEARALASTISASPDALLSYSQAEAEALIRANIDIVEALTAALVAEGTLSGDQVDGIIADCVAQRSLAAEYERRRRWKGVVANANKFEVEKHG
jgi:ATP-dependent Zn protease